MSAKDEARKQLALVDAMLPFEEMKKRGEYLVKSGLLPATIKTSEQAVVIMLMGQEYGISPMKAFQSIHVIQGRPALSAQLKLALCERTGELEDVVIDSHDTYCRVTMKRKNRTPRIVIFGDEDAKSMRTKEWVNGVPKVVPLIEKYNYVTMKKDMYVARAISRACQYTFPDAVLGLVTVEEAYDVLDAKTEEKVEEAAERTDAAEEHKAALDAPTEAEPGSIHNAGADADLAMKLGACYILDPVYQKIYQDRTLSEIVADKTPAGKPKGRQYLERVMKESANPEDRANIEKYLELLDKAEPGK